MKLLLYLFGVLPIWIGLTILIGRLLNKRFGVKPLPAKLWGFALAPIIMLAVTAIFAGFYDQYYESVKAID